MQQLESIERELYIITKGSFHEESLLLNLTTGDYYSRLKNLVQDGRESEQADT